MKKFFSKRHNKVFYLTILSQLLVVTQVILTALGHGDWLTDVLQNKILAVADAVLVLLAMFGLVNDPTTPGIGDKPEDDKS